MAASGFGLAETLFGEGLNKNEAHHALHLLERQHDRELSLA